MIVFKIDDWNVVDKYKDEERIAYSCFYSGEDLRILHLKKMPNGRFDISLLMKAMPGKRASDFNVSSEGLLDFLEKYKHPKGLSEEVIAHIKKTVSANPQTEEGASFMSGGFFNCPRSDQTLEDEKGTEQPSTTKSP